MANKSESSLVNVASEPSLGTADAARINNIQEFVVTRDFDAEMAEFSDLYDKYQEQIKKIRPSWPNPCSEEYYKLNEETFRLIPQFNKEQKRDIDPRYRSEYISVFWKHKDHIVNMWKDLDVLEKDQSAVTAENCLKLVSKAFNSVEGLNIFYNDFPTEDTEYV